MCITTMCFLFLFLVPRVPTDLKTKTTLRRSRVKIQIQSIRSRFLRRNTKIKSCIIDNSIRVFRVIFANVSVHNSLIYVY